MPGLLSWRVFSAACRFTRTEFDCNQGLYWGVDLILFISNGTQSSQRLVENIHDLGFVCSRAARRMNTWVTSWRKSRRTKRHPSTTS